MTKINLERETKEKMRLRKMKEKDEMTSSYPTYIDVWLLTGNPSHRKCATEPDVTINSGRRSQRKRERVPANSVPA